MPKTFNNLFETICSIENLMRATHKAALGKRGKCYIDKFKINLEHEIWDLREELLSQSYCPGKYNSFWITDPKKRLISAAPFRDRVVHHALCNIIEPLWERRFISESFANRKGYGSSKARQHFSKGIFKYKYVLKCDIKKFFPSMDHEILKSIFRRVIKCKKTLHLIDKIVDASNIQEQVLSYFNVDDFALFSDNKSELRIWKEMLGEFSEKLRLKLHNKKTRIFKTTDGITFLGMRFWPAKIRLAAENVKRVKRRLKKKVYQFKKGEINKEDLQRSWAGWRGHAVQADAKGLIKHLKCQAVLWRANGDSNSRVLRGGSWNNNANNCRSANRCWATPDDTEALAAFVLLF